MDDQWPITKGAPMKNGVHFDFEAGEYQIWLDDEFITWASTQPKGQQMYIEALQTKCKHQKNTEQPAWEWFSLTTPDKAQTIAALDLASAQ